MTIFYVMINFRVSFQILFGVVVFGIFHGLFFLPAILSVIGPLPYDSAKKMESTSKEADFGREEKDIPTVASHTNEAMSNGNTVHNGTNGAFVFNNFTPQTKDTANNNGAPVNTNSDDGTSNDTEPNGKVSIVEMHL